MRGVEGVEGQVAIAELKGRIDALETGLRVELVHILDKLEEMSDDRRGASARLDAIEKDLRALERNAASAERFERLQEDLGKLKLWGVLMAAGSLGGGGLIGAALKQLIGG